MNSKSVMLLCLVLVGHAIAQDDFAGSITLEQAASYFTELQQACATNDPDGRLWGVEVYGPVMLVDATTRKIIANQADAQGLLEKRGNVFVGKLPTDQPLANAPIKWAGVRWAMVLTMFLGDTEADRVALLGHESFHRVQLKLGLFAFGRENNHLDTPEGRYWMKLEWNALQAALGSMGHERKSAIRDALAFRAARRLHFTDVTSRENAIEIREGLAQYTGLRLAAATPTQAIDYVIKRRAREDSIVRSFGYNSGPLYGYLLDIADASWRDGLSRKSDLGAMLAMSVKIEPDATIADERSIVYGGPELRIAEAERDRIRQVRLAKFRTLLIDGPVLRLDLSVVTTGTMDTRRVHPLGKGRIVFTVRMLIAEWGRLDVDGGAFLEDRNIGLGYLSMKDAAPDHLSGEGWTLTINKGWAIAAGNREGDLVLLKTP